MALHDKVSLSQVIRNMGGDGYLSADLAKRTIDFFYTELTDVSDKTRNPSESKRKLDEAMVVRAKLPYDILATIPRPSELANEVIRVVGGLYSEIDAWGGEVAIEQLAIQEGTTTAKDSITQVFHDITDNFQNVGSFLLWLNKYAVYVAIGVAFVVFLPQIKLVFARFK